MTPNNTIQSKSNLDRFLAASGVSDYDSLIRRSNADPDWFWNAVITHFRPVFEAASNGIQDHNTPVEHRAWLPGGKLNIAGTCLRNDHGDFASGKPALVWETENGQIETWDRERLGNEVRRASQGLRRSGISVGDRVGILMPMLPETIAAYLAVASVGAIALPLFSGYGAEAIAQRLHDAQAKALVTADGTTRRGREIPIKAIADDALRSAPSVEIVAVVERSGIAFDKKEGRDVSWSELTSLGDMEAVFLDAESELMLVYTSGTSGNPKGTLHSHGGFLLKVLCDLGLLLDMQPGDRVMWMGDFGWLTGPILAVGVLATGGCLIMAEGTPDFPENDRVFELLTRHRVTIFSLSPTLVRAQMAAGTTPSKTHDLSSLRILASTGEAWNPKAWDWCLHHYGAGSARILNYTGGTEIGGSILSGNLLLDDVVCSVGKPAPAMGVEILHDDGSPVSSGEIGELVLGMPSPGLSRGLWHADAVYQETYWSRFPKKWSHGDLVTVDENGFWHIKGRRDDVLKVAGKRIGSVEIENVALRVEGVSEAVVVPAPDDVKGQAIVLFVVVSQNSSTSTETVSEAVSGAFGQAFRPKAVAIVPGLPRTRTNKVMRSVLKKLVEGEEVDVSHVANPEIVKEIQTRWSAL